MQPGSQPYGPPAQAPKKFPVWVIVLIVVLGAVVMLGVVLVSMAIYGTRRYLAAAKTAEAKNTVGAIARGAAQAYDRESGVEGGQHELCKSATPVPASIPAAAKYQPLSSGGDFDTGDEKTGWRCLKFSMTMPMYYQYSYRQGSGYVGSPAPGPDGFEASARGNLDGDDVTSLFVLSGQVKNGTVVLSPTVYVENEFE